MHVVDIFRVFRICVYVYANMHTIVIMTKYDGRLLKNINRMAVLADRPMLNDLMDVFINYAYG